jgi:hypothetical protein
MFRSGQLGLRCSVEPNCSGMSARLAGASVTRDRALDTCEPSCVPEPARPFFIPVVHNPLGAVGYMAAPELSSRGGKAGATWQRRSPPRQGGEVCVRNRTLTLIEREDDIKSWGNFLVYFSQLSLSSRGRMTLGVGEIFWFISHTLPQCHASKGLEIHTYRLLASQEYARC